MPKCPIVLKEKCLVVKHGISTDLCKKSVTPGTARFSSAETTLPLCGPPPPSIDPDKIMLIVKTIFSVYRIKYPKVMYPYFRLLYTDCILKSNKYVSTLAVAFDKNKQKILLNYNPKFLQSLFIECLFNKTMLVDLLVLVVIHELEHIKNGHLTLSIEQMKRYNKNITPEIISIAIDWEVNQIIKETVLPGMERSFELNPLVGDKSIDYFMKFSTFPTPDMLKACYKEYNNKTGDVFYWIGILLDKQEKTNDKGGELKINIELSLGDFSEPDEDKGEGEGEGEEINTKMISVQEGEDKGEDKGEEINTKMISAQEGIGSMDEEDIYTIPKNIISNPIEKIDEAVDERKAKSSQAGNESANNKKIIEKEKGVYRPEIADLVQFYHDLVRSHGEKRGYNRIHVLNSIGILSKRTRLPVICKKRTVKSIFFIDVSGSMDPGKLGKVYGAIKPLIEELGEVYYTAVDEHIHGHGRVRDVSFMENLYGGGGTRFESSVQYWAKKGFTHFVFYTDGDIKDTPFDFPKNMIPEQQVWILVGPEFADSPEEFCMPGFKIGITS